MKKTILFSVSILSLGMGSLFCAPNVQSESQINDTEAGFFCRCKKKMGLESYGGMFMLAENSTLTYSGEIAPFTGQYASSGITLNAATGQLTLPHVGTYRITWGAFMGSNTTIGVYAGEAKTSNIIPGSQLSSNALRNSADQGMFTISFDYNNTVHNNTIGLINNGVSKAVIGDADNSTVVYLTAEQIR